MAELIKPAILNEREPDALTSADFRAQWESKRRINLRAWHDSLIMAPSSQITTPALRQELAAAIKARMTEMKERGEWRL